MITLCVIFILLIIYKICDFCRQGVPFILSVFYTFIMLIFMFLIDIIFVLIFKYSI